MEMERPFRRQSVDVEKRVDAGAGDAPVITKSDSQTQDPQSYDIVKATQV